MQRRQTLVGRVVDGRGRRGLQKGWRGRGKGPQTAVLPAKLVDLQQMEGRRDKTLLADVGMRQKCEPLAKTVQNNWKLHQQRAKLNIAYYKIRGIKNNIACTRMG